jgi:hypothetical protein
MKDDTERRGKEMEKILIDELCLDRYTWRWIYN